MPNNQRQFNRIFYNSTVKLSDQYKTHNCQLIDISLNGCLLKFDTPWLGDLTNLTMVLELSSHIYITMQVKVTHIIDCVAGFQCEYIDIDSISQLRRLVELNLGDNQLLERDLKSLGQLK